jgi:hypothetical protein
LRLTPGGPEHGKTRGRWPGNARWAWNSRGLLHGDAQCTRGSCSLNGQQCVSSGVETPIAYPPESRNSKHGSSLLDKLTLMGAEAAERGLSVNGKARFQRLPSATARTSPQREGLQMTGRASAHYRVPRPPHRTPQRRHITERHSIEQHLIAWRHIPPWSHTRRDISTLRRASTRPPAAAASFLDRLLLLPRPRASSTTA